PECQDALQSAKGMLGQARGYLAIRENILSSIQAKLRAILDTLIAIVDSIFVAFGIADFFELSESKIQGEFKFQKIMMLISFFTLLTATLLPMLGVTTSASIVGGLLLLIAVLSILWPHIRPLPSRIPEGENWSKQIREGKLKTSEGRKKAVNGIAQALSNKQHPLLIGQSGIGKTQTVQAFVQALERGDFPELQGKTVFYFNTANLVGSKEVFGGGNKILKRISEAIGSNRNNCILVFDEIHLAYQAQKNSAIGEQLKIFLDEKEDNFPHVIGLTTEEEYYRDIYKDNAAGDRRFEKIEITTTDRKATIAILNQFLIQKAPDAIVEKETLRYLIKQTKGSPQPLTARKILSQCIKKTAHLHESPISVKVDKVRSTLNSAYYEGAVLGSASLSSEKKNSRKIAQLESQLLDLEDKLKKEEEKLRDLSHAKKNLAKIREAKFRTVLKTSSFKKDQLSSDERTQLSEFVLLKFFLENSLETHVRTQASSLKVKAVIDKTLIDEVLAEEKANAQKRAESIARGKKQLESRNR
ncbi:MAG TPA: AAA family ATPase, partial [Waddliaceae bacterium]